jgi:hypothetical protein
MGEWQEAAGKDHFAIQLDDLKAPEQNYLAEAAG